MNQPRQRGFMDLELMLVFSVIMVVVIAAFVIFPKVRVIDLAYREGSHIRTLTRLMNTGHVLPGVLPSGFYPEEMVRKGQVRSIMGGAVLATMDKSRGGSPHWTLTYQKVPVDVCVKLALFLQDDNPGIQTLTVGSRQVSLKAEARGATPAFSNNQLLDACGNDNPDVLVTMVFSGP